MIKWRCIKPVYGPQEFKGWLNAVPPNMLEKLVAELGTQALRDWLNTVAFANIEPKLVTFETSQADISWLNEDAAPNALVIIVMEEVFHARGWLNEEAARKILSIVVTELVFHARGWLNNVAPANTFAMFVTEIVFHALIF